MLGLVVGPGDVLGVGLVVLGVSVPMPPAAEPPEAPEELPDEELPPDVEPDEPEGMDESEGMPEVPPEELPEELLPDVSGGDPGVDPGVAPVVEPEVLVPLVSAGMPEAPPLLSVLPVVLVPGVPVVPELVPESEPPPVMPAQAPRSIAQAIGNIHFVIDHSRKVQKAVRIAARTGELQYRCRE